ncbi:MAG: DUF1573 domain-containing protein [Alistipes sp.]|nr:DUF1573 domain-containing protein [Alistipes sp.]
MKRLFTIVSLLMLSFSAMAEQNSENGVVFDKNVFDFGNVQRENRDYSCSFIIENRAEKPLVVLSVKTSCSCLKAKYSRRPLKTGEKSCITMTLEAAKMEPGIFHRVVEVETNAGVYRIVVKGNSIGK